MVKPLSFNFSVHTVKLVGVPKFRNFTVITVTATLTNIYHTTLMVLMVK